MHGTLPATQESDSGRQFFGWSQPVAWALVAVRYMIKQVRRLHVKLHGRGSLRGGATRGPGDGTICLKSDDACPAGGLRVQGKARTHQNTKQRISENAVFAVRVYGFSDLVAEKARH